MRSTRFRLVRAFISLGAMMFGSGVDADAQGTMHSPTRTPVLRSMESNDPIFGRQAFSDRVVHDPLMGDQSISELILGGPIIDPAMDGIYPPTVYLPSETVESARSAEVAIERFRPSFFQGAELLGGYLADTGNDASELNQTFEEARVSFGFPLGVLTGGSMDNIIGFRPYFRADQFDGPRTIDVPGAVYDTGVSLLNQKKWSQSLSTTLVITPSIRQDFKTSASGFRLFGLGLLNWKARPNLTISAGVVYSGRNDLMWLPAFGLTYLPTPWWKIDATMPRPRIARRLWKDGGRSEGWAFIGGTIGGNTWAVERASGLDDELTIRAFELIGGYEVIGAGNRGFNVEAAYTFGRRIEYENQDIEIALSDGLGIRAAWQF